MARETLCQWPCAGANNPYVEVLKVKSGACFALISSLCTDDDQNKCQLKKFSRVCSKSKNN